MANDDLILHKAGRAAERERVILEAQVTTGAAAANGDVASYQRQLGIRSIARTAAGVYRITLMRPYTALLQVGVSIEKSTATGFSFDIKAEDVDGLTTPYVDVRFLTTASPPTAACPLSAKIRFTLVLQDAKD